VGSSSNQSFGIEEDSSGILSGSLSSQSSGLTAFSSGILLLSSQSSGFTSFLSTISFGGLIGGLKSSSDNKSPSYCNYKQYLSKYNNNIFLNNLLLGLKRMNMSCLV